MIDDNEIYLDKGNLGPDESSLEARVKRIMAHKYSDLALLLSVALCFGALFLVSAIGQAEGQCVLPH
jgi:hypothetical protein